VGNGAFIGRANQPGIFFQYAGQIALHGLPLLLALLEFCLRDIHLNGACRGINTDMIAIAYQGDGASRGGFRTGIADTHTAGRPGKSAIGQQGYLLARALAIDTRGDRQHFPHAGAASGSLITNHQYFPGLVVHGRYHLHAIFF